MGLKRIGAPSTNTHRAVERVQTKRGAKPAGAQAHRAAESGSAKGSPLLKPVQFDPSEISPELKKHLDTTDQYAITAGEYKFADPDALQGYSYSLLTLGDNFDAFSGGAKTFNKERLEEVAAHGGGDVKEASRFLIDHPLYWNQLDAHPGLDDQVTAEDVDREQERLADMFHGVLTERYPDHSLDARTIAFLVMKRNFPAFDVAAGIGSADKLIGPEDLDAANVASASGVLRLPANLFKLYPDLYKQYAGEDALVSEDELNAAIKAQLEEMEALDEAKQNRNDSRSTRPGFLVLPGDESGNA